MWEIEAEDFCYLDTQNFVFPYDYQPHTPWTSESPQKSETKIQTIIPSKRSSQIHSRKIKRLQRKIKELEDQLKQIKQCQKQQCCTCHTRRIKQRSEHVLSHQCQNTEFMCEMDQCTKHLEFQEFNMIDASAAITPKEPEISAQSWILTGMMMLVMGININGYDETTLDVYKLAKQSIDDIRNQIQNCLDEITLPIFYSKMFNEIPDGNVAAPLGSGTGLQINGIRLDAVEQEALMFEEHISYKLKYEALNVMTEMIKNYVILY